MRRISHCQRTLEGPKSQNCVGRLGCVCLRAIWSKTTRKTGHVLSRMPPCGKLRLGTLIMKMCTYACRDARDKEEDNPQNGHALKLMMPRCCPSAPFGGVLWATCIAFGSRRPMPRRTPPTCNADVVCGCFDVGEPLLARQAPEEHVG